MHADNTPPSRTSMNGFARVGAVIAVVAIGFVVWNILSAHRAAANLASATEEAAITTVSTIHPKPTDPNGSELILPGTVQANIDAPIYARTSGYLKRWLVDIGTRVKAGQLLAEVDTPEVQQQMSQAEADVATVGAVGAIDQAQQLRASGAHEAAEAHDLTALDLKACPAHPVSA